MKYRMLFCTKKTSRTYEEQLCSKEFVHDQSRSTDNLTVVILCFNSGCRKNASKYKQGLQNLRCLLKGYKTFACKTNNITYILDCKCN